VKNHDPVDGQDKIRCVLNGVNMKKPEPGDGGAPKRSIAGTVFLKTVSPRFKIRIKGINIDAEIGQQNMLLIPTTKTARHHRPTPGLFLMGGERGFNIGQTFYAFGRSRGFGKEAIALLYVDAARACGNGFGQS